MEAGILQLGPALQCGVADQLEQDWMDCAQVFHNGVGEVGLILSLSSSSFGDDLLLQVSTSSCAFMEVNRLNIHIYICIFIYGTKRVQGCVSYLYKAGAGAGTGG